MRIEAKEGGYAMITITDVHLEGPREAPDAMEVTRTGDQKMIMQLWGDSDRLPKTATAKSPNITIKFRGNMPIVTEPPFIEWSIDSKIEGDRGRSSVLDGGGDGGGGDTGSDGEVDSGFSQGGDGDEDGDGGDGGGGGGGALFSTSFSYSEFGRKKRKRRDTDAVETAYRGFRIEITWVPATKGKNQCLGEIDTFARLFSFICYLLVSWEFVSFLPCLFLLSIFVNL